jgi:hypothetical protein
MIQHGRTVKKQISSRPNNSLTRPIVLILVTQHKTFGGLSRLLAADDILETILHATPVKDGRS